MAWIETGLNRKISNVKPQNVKVCMSFECEFDQAHSKPITQTFLHFEFRVLRFYI